MFKISAIFSLAVSALLLSCASLPQPQPAASETLPSSVHHLLLMDKNGGKYPLITQDNFQHAVLTDLQGRRHLLTQTVSGSGIRLSSPQGAVVHFKADAGYILLEKDQYIEVSVLPE